MTIFSDTVKNTLAFIVVNVTQTFNTKRMNYQIHSTKLEEQLEALRKQNRTLSH